MKQIFLTTLLLLGFLFIAKAQGPQPDPFKPEKGMVLLNDYVDKTIELTVGQKAYFQVVQTKEELDATGAVLYADDPAIISMLHDKAHWQIQGKGDKEKHTKTTVFEAVGKGTTKIMYEGEDIKSGQDIVKTITVVVK
ncbi:MAG: hypothetical protein EAZ55_11155, partial [Cytophagales bacterium]